VDDEDIAHDGSHDDGGNDEALFRKKKIRLLSRVAHFLNFNL
jgi:hypothetical protein